MSATDEEILLPGNLEEFEAAIDEAIAVAVESTLEAIDDADAEDFAKLREDDPGEAFEVAIAKHLSENGGTRQQAVLAVARTDSALARAANDAKPAQLAKMKPAEHFQKSVPIVEAEQSPDGAHEVSDRWRAEQRDHDAAQAEFKRRAQAIVTETAATSKPLSFQQAALAVARADHELYQRARTLPSHDA